MTPQEIRDAIAADAALQAYAAGGDYAAVAALLSQGTQLGVVSTERFQAWAAATGMRAVIEDTTTNAQHPLRSIALTLRDVLVGGASGINFAYPGNPEMLDAWVALGLLSTQHRDALLALAQVPLVVSWQQVMAAVQET